MYWDANEKRYIIHAIKARAKTDYSGCYYESDIPTTDLELETKELTLDEFLRQLSVEELAQYGLVRVSKETTVKPKRVKKNARG